MLSLVTATYKLPTNFQLLASPHSIAQKPAHKGDIRSSDLDLSEAETGHGNTPSELHNKRYLIIKQLTCVSSWLQFEQVRERGERH